MEAKPWPRFLPAGDCALAIQFGEEIDPATNRRVHALDAALSREPAAGIETCIPGYCTLLVQYDPLVLDLPALLELIQARLGALDDQPVDSARLVEIPIRYGGEYGPDLAEVARLTGLAESEVVRIHAAGEYQVYMIGFSPGFPYLGGMDERIAAPRLKTPRTLVPAGSVGIAGKQTGVYTVDSPGGWQLIGRTTLNLFDPQRDPPSLLAPGDRLRFVPVTQEDAP